ncbi:MULTISPECIES: ABC-F family ATP-binding cassette domain-containing protein [Enterococcaceae]|uniref:ABC-F family ATP-binding cassette domain-containing protein n=1 Tax=Enterococcaceae TaxID=81852 RepID=UPI000E469C54|nr:MULTISPECIES: ABC-F family ATP-binding cassette domain-containing protein [Enterococcaceae]RGI31758.1 ABC transporter ATP-binding protein [Melissococcus sp. OM08-11BH]UNM90237.1 ABC-F family ATP-binding cassette domain-containing protein [Vagococcus sp. CY52-2]
MKLLRADNLDKNYGTKQLLDNVSFLIKEKDRIGLIGINGTGKSTLIKILSGKDHAEKGSIDYPNDYKIGYLSQDTIFSEDISVLDAVFDDDTPVMKAIRSYEKALVDLAQDGENPAVQKAYEKAEEAMNKEDAWLAETSAKTILNKLGILFLDKKVSELSGGQQKRLGLAQVLIQSPDLLLLDEPTNHLDYETIQWLEDYLNHYQGSLIVITHDRYFLDRVTNRIFELANGTLHEYTGNYQAYLVQRAEREEQEKKSLHKNKQLFKQELAWMRAGVKARGTKQQARINRFNDLKDKVSGSSDKGNLEFSVGTKRLGKKVIEIEHANFKIANQVILKDFELLVQANERLGITGENGSGKSTLLNLIAGNLTLDSGVIELGETVNIGYYTQTNDTLDESKRIISYLQEIAEEVKQQDGTVISVTEMLERFLFPRNVHGTLISKLSGGEKRRLYLLSILIQQPNVLLLDEPTNDLDVETLTILEDYLSDFPGAVIAVSHDRYFLDKTMDKLLIFKGQGDMTTFYGSMSDYVEQTGEQESVEKTTKSTTTKKVDKVVSNDGEKKKLTYKEKIEWDTIEEEIAQLEENIESLNEQMLDNSSDAIKLQDLQATLTTTEQTLEDKLERWEYLSEFAD